jgi:hypothetical protein
MGKGGGRYLLSIQLAVSIRGSIGETYQSYLSLSRELLLSDPTP